MFWLEPLRHATGATAPIATAMVRAAASRHQHWGRSGWWKGAEKDRKRWETKAKGSASNGEQRPAS